MVRKATTTNGEVALDRRGQLALRNLRRLKAEAADLDAKVRAAEAKVKAALGDAEAGTVKGRVAVTWKKVIRSSISNTLLVKRFPADELAECRELREVRTLRIVEE